MVGSGPYRYLAAERVAGARNAYARFDHYEPRPQGTASLCAGPRVAHFDRVEWITTPDPATQVAALQNGEVDWVEQPQMDLVPSLRRAKGIKVEVAENRGLVGYLRFNQLFPPQLQEQAFTDVPFLPLGSYEQPTAYRANLMDMIRGLISFTNVRRV